MSLTNTKHLKTSFLLGQCLTFTPTATRPIKRTIGSCSWHTPASKAGNTLTIVKNKDEDLDKKIAKWENKGVPFVKAEVAPYPRKFTLDKTKAVVVVNIAPTTAVFDATAVPDAMLDGGTSNLSNR